MLTPTILFIMKIYYLLILTCSVDQDYLNTNTCIMNGIYWLQPPIKYPVFTHLIIPLLNKRLQTAYHDTE